MRNSVTRSVRIGIFTSLLLAGVADSLAITSVEYTVSLARREEHLLDVRMKVSGANSEPLEVALPVWNNLYQIRDFVQFLQTISAVDGQGAPVVMNRIGKSNWQVQVQGDSELEIRYSIGAVLPGSFGAELTPDHAFLHAALFCLFLPQFREVPHSIRFQDRPSRWQIATGLEKQGDAYRAQDYDHLVDSPFEISEFEMESFDWQGVQYQVAVHGRSESFRMKDLTDLLQRIVAYEVGLMGPPPFLRFVFIYHVDQNGSGGMEHRNSTAIGLSLATVERGIESAASVSAHEFFHLWNVKLIHPAEFDRMDWLHETPTRALWLSEGGTSYYSLLTLIRAEIISEKEFYRQLSRQIQTLQRRPARLFQSVEQSSWETWFDRYPDYHRPESSISYYNKGLLVSLLLDLEIRQRTENRRSLDDVMRWMNIWFGARRVGFQPGDIQRAVESVSQSSFEAFFQSYVSGVEELPYSRVLGFAGLVVEEETEEGLVVRPAGRANARQKTIRSSLLQGIPARPR